MASKNKIKITLEPVIFLIFAFITVAVFIVNKFLPSAGLNRIFTSPTSLKGDLPFSFKDPFSWMRIIFYIFGTKNIYFWILLPGIRLLLPELETNFGTGLISIMILLSTVFSGVLFACFSKTSYAGCEPVVFLLIILNLISSFKKKYINLSDIFAAAFFCVFFFAVNTNLTESLIPFFICFAGGLCGSLVSFITVKKTSSKKKPVKKSTKKDDDAQTVVYFDNEADSPRFKNKNNSSSEDETVVGTLTF